MKILFSLETFLPPKSGGDMSALALAEELAKKHDVSVICVGPGKGTRTYKKIKVNYIKSPASRKLLGWAKRYHLNKDWKRILNKHMKEKENKYDLVITQGIVTASSVMIAKKYDSKVITFVRGYDHFCLSHLRDGPPEKHNCLKHASMKWKIQYPYFKLVIKDQEWALKNSDVIISNSKFMKGITKKWYELKSEVIYPFVRIKDYKTKRNPKYITMVRPVKWKGSEVFVKIAEKMPDKEFLAAGGEEKLKELSNLKYTPWLKDIRNAYKETKILLAPALWYEPFGRVAVEAMANGIPCIVSNRGGLKESVDKAGIILDPTETDKWVKAINKLEDKKYYDKLSKLSLKRAEMFDFKTQYKKFENILSRLK